MGCYSVVNGGITVGLGGVEVSPSGGLWHYSYVDGGITVRGWKCHILVEYHCVGEWWAVGADITVQAL